MDYTTMAHAAKQVLNENTNAKKLLGLSEIVEKWIQNTFKQMNVGVSSYPKINSMANDLINQQQTI
jgi:hypothetical protein